MGLIRNVPPQLWALGNMLIKFLHMGKHESWKTVSLKGEREINFGVLVSPKISRQRRMICHAEDIAHAISSSSLVQSLSLLSASCRHISLHQCKCRSLKPLTLLLWSQQTSLSFLYMYFIVLTKSFPLGFISCFPLWVNSILFYSKGAFHWLSIASYHLWDNINDKGRIFRLNIRKALPIVQLNSLFSLETSHTVNVNSASPTIIPHDKKHNLEPEIRVAI